MHKTGEWANYFKEGDPVALEKDFIKVSQPPMFDGRSFT